MLRALLLSLIYLLAGARADVVCTCVSVGTALQIRGSTPSVAKIRNGTTFVVSNIPGKTGNVTRTVYPNAVLSTQACACSEEDVSPVRYILSARQRVETAESASTCLGSEVINKTCAALAIMGVFECDNLWSSGAAGSAHPAVVKNGVLEETARRITISHGPICSRSIVFETSQDDVIISAGNQ